MTADPSDMVWLSESVELTVEQFAEQSGLTQEQLCELIDCGAIAPAQAQTGEARLRADMLVIARTASRMGTDFELDSRGLALAIALLERIRTLEATLRQLRAELPRLVR